MSAGVDARQTGSCHREGVHAPYLILLFDPTRSSHREGVYVPYLFSYFSIILSASIIPFDVIIHRFDFTSYSICRLLCRRLITLDM